MYTQDIDGGVDTGGSQGGDDTPEALLPVLDRITGRTDLADTVIDCLTVEHDRPPQNYYTCVVLIPLLSEAGHSRSV